MDKPDETSSLESVVTGLEDCTVEAMGEALDDWTEVEVIEGCPDADDVPPNEPINLAPLAAALKFTAPWQDFS
jgi:hypothetical protein